MSGAHTRPPRMVLPKFRDALHNGDGWVPERNFDAAWTAAVLEAFNKRWSILSFQTAETLSLMQELEDEARPWWVPGPSWTDRNADALRVYYGVCVEALT